MNQRIPGKTNRADSAAPADDTAEETAGQACPRYEHAETLRNLFEAKRRDKDGPVFITHTGEAYPW